MSQNNIRDRVETLLIKRRAIEKQIQEVTSELREEVQAYDLIIKTIQDSECLHNNKKETYEGNDHDGWSKVTYNEFWRFYCPDCLKSWNVIKTARAY